ncbi:class I adenylate-forming enzyme family protein [Halomarina salina]|uniref:Class I adenylate-forming enzyme family protein n=1 Tax=Halomarina salina TaxID=1872699 RepID=A0ABD5RTS8_9EURY|nr:AMP-binding protein [Halomarina salina]
MSWRGATLNQLLDTAADEHADTEALVTADERLTYAELHDRVREFARGLLSLGVRTGDRVGVLLSNRVEWFVATYATERVGATMVGLNTWYKPDELRYALRQADVSTLVTLDSFLDNDYLEMLTSVDPAIVEGDGTNVNSTVLPVLQTVVVVGDAPSWTVHWDEVVDRADGVTGDRLAATAEAVEPDDEAYVLFSSGTTGRPKPIVLEHDGLVTNPRSIGARLGVDAGDRFWLGLPLFFSFAACNESITAFAHGATLVVQERFDAREAVDLVREEECTVLYGMGNMFKSMERLDTDLRAAFDSVRVALAVAPRPVRRRLEEEHGVDRALNCYGLTEVSAICAITHHDSDERSRRETVGHPLANVDVRVKDPETDVEVAPGERGEIRIRSRTMFREYLKRPEKTREAFDEAGYFRTGDLGWLEADGRLVFEGRITDMIKTGGINVSPEEVRRVVGEHPGVEEAVVVGLPDDRRDEVVAAAVRPADGHDLTGDDVIEFCAERISAYKVPDVVVVRDEAFPRTDTGKVRTFEVREELAAETGRDA